MVEQIGDNYRLKMNNDAQKCKTIKWIQNDIKKNRELLAAQVLTHLSKVIKWMAVNCQRCK